MTTVIHGESLGKAPTLNLSGRIPELDGLRGLAIGMVFIYHLYVVNAVVAPATPLSYLLAGLRLTWSGVDLFFVLSGFLIGGILLDNRRASNYFKTFYVRRSFRIIPVYFLSLSVLYALVRMNQGGSYPKFTFLHSMQVLPWIPHLLFIQNFWMAARETTGLVGVSWSLAVEEQFYLTLPLLIRILSPKRLVATICVVIASAPILRIVLLFTWPGHPHAGFALLPCRADSLMLGVLAAIAIRNPRWNQRLQRNRRALRVALALFTVGFLLLTKFAPSQFGFGMQTLGFTWLAAFYTCFLLYALTFREGVLSAFLRWSPLRWLGTVAYGVYLFHVFVMWWIFGLTSSSWPLVRNLREFGASLVVILLTLLLCEASWRLIEKPLIRLSHRAQYDLNQSRTGSQPVTSPVEERA